MGKHGPCASIREIIEHEVKAVEEILARSSLNKDDQKEVLDILKEMAYQWCSSNAGACAIEDAALRLLGPERSHELFQEFLKSGMKQDKMRETFPFE